MMAKQFKVGDRVKFINNGGYILSNNQQAGEIVGYRSSKKLYDVKIDNYRTLSFSIDELIPETSKPSKNERISLLESQVADLSAKVEALEKKRKPATALTQAPTIHNVTVNIDSAKSAVDIGKLIAEGFAKGLGGKPISTPNQQRKAVIERAKAFVTDWESKCGREISYVVNVEKRTVVALKHRKFFGIIGEVIGRGIAKCAPDDVFNADIGKAIALGRALGLSVSEFENAVKPTEFATGQSITYRGRKQKITSVDDGRARISPVNFHWTYRANEPEYAIIDDTDAEYV